MVIVSHQLSVYFVFSAHRALPVYCAVGNRDRSSLHFSGEDPPLYPGTKPILSLTALLSLWVSYETLVALIPGLHTFCPQSLVVDPTVHIS